MSYKELYDFCQGLDIHIGRDTILDKIRELSGQEVRWYMRAMDRTELQSEIRRAAAYPPEMVETSEDIDAMIARRRRVMGGRLYVFYDPPLHMVKGEGVWLTASDGKRYLDCYNNVPHVGHCHPYVTEAIVRQARTLNTNTRYITGQSIDYAERLSALSSEGLSAVVFVNSGSEANDLAWRMAKAWTGKSGGLAMDFAYHGITEAIDAFSPSNAPASWYAPHLRLLPAPCTYRGTFGPDEPDLGERYAELAGAVGERLFPQCRSEFERTTDALLRVLGQRELLERDVQGEGAHRFHAGFLDYARHAGFVIKLCRPYRARTKGKVERFNGYLRRSFYVPLVAQFKQAGLVLDAATATVQVRRWLDEVANVRVHGTTGEPPLARLAAEQAALQALAPPWRGDIEAARPQQTEQTKGADNARPPGVRAHLETAQPAQHPQAIYDQLLQTLQRSQEVGA